jgi:Tfp pilus assembly protein PilF
MLPVVLFFVLSLMSKPMSVTLPFVLLLLDWWPLQRIGTVPLRSIVLEKVPLLFLSTVACVVTIAAQQMGGAVITVERISLFERMTTALASYMLYLSKMVWPYDLAILYPLPATPPFRLAAFGAVVIILVTLAVFRLRKTQPYLLVGWLWFLGMLVPVIGLVQVGVQSHADRYTYLPIVGCSVALTWGLHDLSAGWRYGHRVFGMISAGLLLIFAFQSRQQVFVWHDSETLFRHALAITRDNYIMHTNLGIALWDSNRPDEAITEFRTAIAICPKDEDQHFILANALLVRGDVMEAVTEYRTSLNLRPDYPHAHTNLGMALQKLGRFEEAIAEYREGLRLSPDDYKARENLQLILTEQQLEGR